MKNLIIHAVTDWPIIAGICFLADKESINIRVVLLICALISIVGNYWHGIIDME